jgi:hypothetical protein
MSGAPRGRARSITPRQQIDSHFGLGLTHGSPDHFFAGGYSFGVDHLFRREIDLFVEETAGREFPVGPSGSLRVLETMACAASPRLRSHLLHERAKPIPRAERRTPLRQGHRGGSMATISEGDGSTG